MAYTNRKYPDTMKNLDDTVRLKAIDILNAMMTDGYDEENAIPIAISSAKKWFNNASKKDIESLHKKDITKHHKSSSTSAHLQDADVKVYYDDEKEMWAVKSIGAKSVASFHNLKSEALEEAKKISDNRDSKLIKYTKDGKVQK